MGWASGHIARLNGGETVAFRPRGNSMFPRIRSGQLCTVSPVRPEDVVVGDVVLCKVRGREFLHFVKAVRDGQFLIANSDGHVNGWIGPKALFGKLMKVE